MSNEDFLQICGAISGSITDPYSDQADKHAERYYSAIRKRKDDIEKIAANTKYTIEQVTDVKNYVFMEKHDLGDGDFDYFDPSCSMAQSWQRLIDGKNIQPHDLTMMEHELMELTLVNQGFSQNDAHNITSKQYNYRKESEEYYGKIKKHQTGQ